MKKQDKIKAKIKLIHREEEEEKIQKFASKFKLPYLNLSIIPVDPSGLKIVPLPKAKESEVMILRKFGKGIKIAVKNPDNEKTEELLKELKDRGYALEIFIVSQSSLETAWKRYEGIKREREKITREVEITPEKISELQEEISTSEDIRNKLKAASRMAVTEILEIVFAGALKIEASDIHFEAEEEQARLRFRADGILQDVTDLPIAIYPSIISRIKILSELKINVHNVPQDGRFSIIIGKTEIEIRTSIVPGAYGENIVLRILNPKTIGLEFENLGLEEYAFEIVNREIKKPNGMIINTGPTGSGKTTTLYAFLKKINRPEIKIITLENPIEYHLEGIQQTQVNPKKGYTFIVGLKAALRQDPDVMLIGEIRDEETAGTAIQAALTGHLVFTTLHTNDAAGAIPRLVDMKVKPTLIPPAVNLVIAQRLIRRVCKSCTEEYKPDEKALNQLKETLKTILTDIKAKYPKIDKNLTLLKVGKGCKKCNMTGYKGRVAVVELFTIDREMEKLIIKSPSIAEVHETAVERGMITLKQDAILKVLNKVTTIEEIERILGT
jgi:type IV pilus assembly protein PilB